jgi:hypothetical protein
MTPEDLTRLEQIAGGLSLKKHGWLTDGIWRVGLQHLLEVQTATE